MKNMTDNITKPIDTEKQQYPDLYVFPVLFEIDKDIQYGDQIYVSYPDLPHCFSNGKTTAEALINASDALGGILYWMERDGNPIPEPSDIKDIDYSANQFVSLVAVDMVSVRRSWDNRKISKMVFISAWLDELALKENLNLSEILQQSLEQILEINNKKKGIK